MLRCTSKSGSTAPDPFQNAWVESCLKADRLEQLEKTLARTQEECNRLLNSNRELSKKLHDAYTTIEGLARVIEERGVAASA